MLWEIAVFFSLTVNKYETDPNKNSKNLPIGIKYDANSGWLKKNNLSSINGFSNVKFPPNCAKNTLTNKKKVKKPK